MRKALLGLALLLLSGPVLAHGRDHRHGYSGHCGYDRVTRVHYVPAHRPKVVYVPARRVVVYQRPRVVVRPAYVRPRAGVQIRVALGL